MAGGVNKVILIGHLGADPEVRYTPGGQPVANFRIATTENWSDKSGQRQERTEWHRIVAWGKLAELSGEYLSRGRQVYVEGKLQTRQWNDREGGKHSTTEIMALQIVFLGGRGDAASQQPRRTPLAAAAAAVSEPAAHGGPLPHEMGFDDGPPPITDDDVPF